MTATYTKLRDGSWGIRAQVGSQERIEIGERVSVAKRDGSTKTEAIAQVLWRSEDGRTVLAAITATSAPRKSRKYGSGRWTGCACGSIEDHPRASDCARCQFDSI